VNKVETMLLDIGIPANQLGFAYITDALKAISENDSLMYDTGLLYEYIAQKVGARPPRVERAIRHAVESAFNRVDPETLERYFGNSVDMRRGKPTNSAFLATISLHLKEEVREA